MIKKFCEENRTFTNYPYPYKLPSIPPTQISKDYNEILQDYLSINNKLIYGELKHTLTKYTKDNEYYKDDLDYLYDNIKHKRNMCSLFEVAIKEFSRNYEDYISMIKRFDKHNNITLKTFCIVFNGIANIFLKWYGYHYATLKKLKSYGFGFDAFIFNHSSDNDSYGQTLSKLCESYILYHMTQTSVFTNKDNPFISVVTNATDKDIKDSLLAKENALVSIKKSLFSNNSNEFSKLIEYCIQDIRGVKQMNGKKFIIFCVLTVLIIVIVLNANMELHFT